MSKPNDRETRAAIDLLVCESILAIECKAEADPSVFEVRLCSCPDRLSCSIKGRGEENRDRS